MEKRHQVFISSTYADLVDERAEVIQALLELDCIPAGMELFPATTEGAWDLIKGVIDDSDYYCLIVGGRYGSLDADGVSYTEKEYDYAVSKGKPLIAFIHGNPGGIVSSKIEKSDKGKDLLKAFVDKVEGAHHRKTWTSAEELGGLVSRGIVNLRKNHPAEGWVRGRFAASDAVLIELANLRARVAELSARAALAPGDLHPDEIAQMASGDQTYLPSISCVENGKTDREHVTAKTTWDTILKYVGPSLLNECTDAEFAERLKLCFYHSAESASGKKLKYESIVIPLVVVDQVKIQLRALGQMVPGTKRRAVSDKVRYWKLTDVGEKRLMSAQALKLIKPAIGLTGLAAALATLPGVMGDAAAPRDKSSGGAS